MTTKDQLAKDAEEYKAGWGIDILAAPKKATGDEFSDEFNSEDIAKAAAEGAVEASKDTKKVVTEPT